MWAAKLVQVLHLLARTDYSVVTASVSALRNDALLLKLEAGHDRRSGGRAHHVAAPHAERPGGAQPLQPAEGTPATLAVHGKERPEAARRAPFNELRSI